MVIDVISKYILFFWIYFPKNNSGKKKPEIFLQTINPPLCAWYTIVDPLNSRLFQFNFKYFTLYYKVNILLLS